MGFIFAIIAGALMAVQGVLNTRLKEATSTWVSNAFVHGTGLIVCLIMWFFTDKESFAKLLKVDHKLSLIGGILGAFIVFSVIKSMHSIFTK